MWQRPRYLYTKKKTYFYKKKRKIKNTSQFSLKKTIKNTRIELTKVVKEFNLQKQTNKHLSLTFCVFHVLILEYVSFVWPVLRICIVCMANVNRKKKIYKTLKLYNLF